MARTKHKNSGNLQELIDMLFGQAREIKNHKSDLKEAKALNQTSNQIMNGFKIRLSAYKNLGKNASVEQIKGFLT